jgi:RNA polymerase sigma factor (sigma-70 family)
MATSPVHDVLDHVRRTALREQDAACTDGELLTRFLARRDEAAFEALVRRHGPMVLGVCRRILGSHADAEDAFQATFLVLIRKAASIRPRERVANWLHGVALHTAQKARAVAARRREKERQAGDMHRPTTPDDRWGELLPLLDQELRRLPDRYRLPIVLCELEGKTHQEAARQLGWPIGTVSGRLSRGRALLAYRLKRQGAAPQDLAPAVLPPALTAAVVKAATAFAAGSAAAVVSAKVIALAEGAVKTMLLTKLQAITAVLLLAALVGVGTALAFASGPGREARAPTNPDSTPPAKDDKGPEPTPPDPEEKAVRDYVAELRAAVKNPTDDHHVYRMVIDRRFHKAVTWAARHGEDELVVELIKDYYGPGNPDRGGTALTWAAWLNDGETVQILLDRGAKVNAADGGGRTALHLAVGWGPNMTKLLLDKGADVNARTKSGETPLLAAAAVDAAVIVEAAIDPATTVHLLLDKGADVNAQDDSGRTALMVAAEQGHLQNAKALLSEGANVRLKNKKGERAIDLVKPAEDYLKLTGAWTAEGLKRRQDQAEKDAKALHELLERAGGKE